MISSLPQRIMETFPFKLPSSLCHHPNLQLLGLCRLVWAGKQVGWQQIFTLPLLLQSHSQLCRRPPLWPFPTLCLHSQETKQILVEQPAFLLPPVAFPSPSPFLGVSSQCLETDFTRKPQWPHLSGFQQNLLAGNTKLPHSPKNQREATEIKGKKKDKTRYQRLQLQSSQTQKSRCQSKNTISNSRNSPPPPGSETLTTESPEYGNQSWSTSKRP